jgi:hypothetical protein
VFCCCPWLGSVELRPRRLCRPFCDSASWPFFYETDTPIYDVSLKKNLAGDIEEDEKSSGRCSHGVADLV